MIEQEEHRRVRPHLPLDFREDIAEHRPHEARALQETPEFKRLYRMLPEHVHVAVKNPIVLGLQALSPDFSR